MIATLAYSITLALLVLATSFSAAPDIDCMALAIVLVQIFFLIFCNKIQYTYLLMFNIINISLITFPFIFQSHNDTNLELIGNTSQYMQVSTAVIFTSSIFLTNLLYNFISNAITYKSKLPKKNDKINKKYFIFFFIILVELFGFYFYGTDEIFLPRNSQVEIERSNVDIFLLFSLKCLPAFLCSIYISDNLQKNRWPICSLVLLLIGGSLLINNPLNTPRFVSLASLLIMAFPLIERFKLLRPFVLSLPVLFMVVLPISTQMRLGWDNVDTTKISEAFSSGEFSALLILNEAFARLPDPEPTYGAHLLSALFVMVPRTIWTSKNTGTGLDVADQLNFNFTNVGIPPIYDFYVDFGYFGIPIFAALMAFALYLAQRALLTGQLFSLQKQYALIVFVNMPVFLRGDMTTAAVVIYAMMASATFVWLCVKVFNGWAFARNNLEIQRDIGTNIQPEQ